MSTATLFGRGSIRLGAAALALAVAVACGGNPPPAAPGPGADPFPGAPTTPSDTPPPPQPPPTPPPVPGEPGPITADPYETKTVDEINADSPLEPVFFLYDSEELSDEARRVLADNATVLRQYTSWVITIEGHCDERGTPEYNLALGDRRALAAKTYLQSLGISAERLHTVSYGKEFPFDPSHTETAWAQNRRAHLVVTAK
jgi:peptidoglycan-associated lipoprotein